MTILSPANTVMGGWLHIAADLEYSLEVLTEC